MSACPKCGRTGIKRRKSDGLRNCRRCGPIGPRHLLIRLGLSPPPLSMSVWTRAEIENSRRLSEEVVL